MRVLISSYYFWNTFKTKMYSCVSTKDLSPVVSSWIHRSTTNWKKALWYNWEYVLVLLEQTDTIFLDYQDVGMPAEFIIKLQQMFKDLKLNRDMNEEFRTVCPSSRNNNTMMGKYYTYVQGTSSLLCSVQIHSHSKSSVLRLGPIRETRSTSLFQHRSKMFSRKSKSSTRRNIQEGN